MKTMVKTEALYRLVDNVCGMEAVGHLATGQRGKVSFTCPHFLPENTSVSVLDGLFVMMDGQQRHINPLAGIQSAELIERLGFPRMRPDARILLVSSNVNHTWNAQNYELVYPAVTGSNKFFLITQRSEHSHRNHVDAACWQEVQPELSTNMSYPALNESIKLRWRYWYTVGQNDNCVMESWLIPVGYFNISKTSQGKFYNPTDPTLGDCSEAYPFFERADDWFLQTYRDVELQNELDYERVSRDCCTSSLELVQLCNELNQRLDQIRQAEGFANVKSLKLERYSEQPFNYNGRLFNAAQAEVFVGGLEADVVAYQTFQPEFESRRNKVVAISGYMNSITSTKCVVVEFPRAEADPEDGSVYEKRSFSYSLIGLVAFIRWLEESRATYDKALNSLVQHSVGSGDSDSSNDTLGNLPESTLE